MEFDVTMGPHLIRVSGKLIEVRQIILTDRIMNIHRLLSVRLSHVATKSDSVQNLSYLFVHSVYNNEFPRPTSILPNRKTSFTNDIPKPSEIFVHKFKITSDAQL